MRTTIPAVNELEQFRRNANAILGGLQALLPNYAAGLPNAADQPEGRLFVLTTTQTLYQVQSGAWVAVELAP